MGDYLVTPSLLVLGSRPWMGPETLGCRVGRHSAVHDGSSINLSLMMKMFMFKTYTSVMSKQGPGYPLVFQRKPNADHITDGIIGTFQYNIQITSDILFGLHGLESTVIKALR